MDQKKKESGSSILFLEIELGAKKTIDDDIITFFLQNRQRLRYTAVKKKRELSMYISIFFGDSVNAFRGGTRQERVVHGTKNIILEHFSSSFVLTAPLSSIFLATQRSLGVCVERVS